MITRQNIIVHELIGLRAEVAASASKPLIGLAGVVVDETKNTLTLERGGRERIVPKRACTFRFHLPQGGDALVRGSLIALEPVERLKKLAKEVGHG
ncbi:MAG: ribonuclease P protein component 1 [Candidatus Micrarchaeia archaeon]